MALKDNFRISGRTILIGVSEMAQQEKSLATNLNMSSIPGIHMEKKLPQVALSCAITEHNFRRLKKQCGHTYKVYLGHGVASLHYV